jgi:hypothetical protein
MVFGDFSIADAHFEMTKQTNILVIPIERSDEGSPNTNSTEISPCARNDCCDSGIEKRLLQCRNIE